MTEQEQKIFSQTKAVLLVVGSLLIIAIVLLWNQYTKEPPKHIDNSFLEEQIEELRNKNDTLQTQIHLRDDKMSVRDVKIDSLLNLKPEIRTEYVTIYKEIDNSSVIDLVELSDSILSAEGITN